MKTKTILTGVFAAVAVAIGVTTIALVNQPANNQTGQVAPAETTQPAASNTISYAAEAGKNVLDQLKEKATVEVKDSTYGPYVDAINGIHGGTDGKYWSFYVDGKLADVGAAAYTAKGGELIEWKFE